MSGGGYGMSRLGRIRPVWFVVRPGRGQDRFGRVWWVVSIGGGDQKIVRDLWDEMISSSELSKPWSDDQNVPLPKTLSWHPLPAYTRSSSRRPRSR